MSRAPCSRCGRRKPVVAPWLKRLRPLMQRHWKRGFLIVVAAGAVLFALVALPWVLKNRLSKMAEEVSEDSFVKDERKTPLAHRETNQGPVLKPKPTQWVYRAEYAIDRQRLAETVRLLGGEQVVLDARAERWKTLIREHAGVLKTKQVAEMNNSIEVEIKRIDETLVRLKSRTSEAQEELNGLDRQADYVEYDSVGLRKRINEWDGEIRKVHEDIDTLFHTIWDFRKLVESFCEAGGGSIHAGQAQAPLQLRPSPIQTGARTAIAYRPTADLETLIRHAGLDAQKVERYIHAEAQRCSRQLGIALAVATGIVRNQVLQTLQERFSFYSARSLSETNAARARHQEDRMQYEQLTARIAATPGNGGTAVAGPGVGP